MTPEQFKKDLQKTLNKTFELLKDPGILKFIVNDFMESKPKSFNRMLGDFYGDHGKQYIAGNFRVDADRIQAAVDDHDRKMIALSLQLGRDIDGLFKICSGEIIKRIQNVPTGYNKVNYMAYVMVFLQISGIDSLSADKEGILKFFEFMAKYTCVAHGLNHTLVFAETLKSLDYKIACKSKLASNRTSGEFKPVPIPKKVLLRLQKDI